MSRSQTSAPEPAAPDEGPPRSCYLLEFSVLPGGVRLGHVHAGGDLGELLEAFGRDWEEAGEMFGHLVLSYGAVLHLWIVQQGVIVGGIDLHPFLRTGDGRCDWALDRDALAAVAPPLTGPVLAAGRVGVRWAEPALRHPESHLHAHGDPAEPVFLHFGLNDLEG